MSESAKTIQERTRLAEVICALSLATDIGSGQPFGTGLRAAVLATRLADAAGLTPDEASDAYYLALLRYIGCTADSHISARVFGDELATGAWFPELDSTPTAFVSGILRNQGRGLPASARARQISQTLARLPSIMSLQEAHCEVAQRLSVRLCLSDGVQAGITQLMVRWDGKLKSKRALSGDAIPRPARVAMLARDATVFHRIGGAAAARQMARDRGGGAHDPLLSDVLVAAGEPLFARFDDISWDDALLSEPGLPAVLSPNQLRAALEAVADFVDLKFPTLAGHSRGVAELAQAAALHARLGADDADLLYKAGLLHDVGRVAVSARVWQRDGPLSDDDWEKVRLHAYHTERVLSRAGPLTAVAKIASLHHERLDGTGYHRGATRSDLVFVSRLLAAADAFHARLEPRPHRRSVSADLAAAQVREEARRGMLDPEAVDAVCAAAGQPRTSQRRAWPNGLTDREVEVLRLLAEGMTNAQIAHRLHVVPKTAGHHVEHVYNKVGVSTRAAAALFAMEHGLVRGARKDGVMTP